MAIRLILVDDHPIILHGLQRLFEREPDFEVVQCCSGGEEAIAAVRAHPPDVLVLDLKMTGCDGLEVLRTLAAEGRACRTVIMTAAIRPDEVNAAVALGVAGIALKESAPAALVECVRNVHQGLRRIEAAILARAAGRGEETPLSEADAALTSREREIIRLVALGLRNKELAERLAISEGTVKTHLHHIYRKLGVEGRLGLMVAAQQKGLA